MSYRYKSGDSWLTILGLILVLVALVWVEVQIACWLWGILMVGIFNLPMVTSWQMFGLMILANLIMPSGSYHSK